MQEEYLILQLKKLQQEKPSQKLQEKIYARSTILSAKHSNFYFPLLAFRGALVGTAFFAFILITGGVVAANMLSFPGKPLYRIRQAVQTVVPPVIKIEKVDNVVPLEITAMPTITPAPSVTPTITPTPSINHSINLINTNDENDHEGKQEHLVPQVQNIHVPEREDKQDFEENDN